MQLIWVLRIILDRTHWQLAWSKQDSYGIDTLFLKYIGFELKLTFIFKIHLYSKLNSLLAKTVSKQDCLLQCQAQLEQNAVFRFYFPIKKPQL